MSLKGWFFLNPASFSAVCAHPAKELRTSPGNSIRLRSTPHSSTLLLYYIECVGILGWRDNKKPKEVVLELAV
jgi:hypothetical protein